MAGRAGIDCRLAAPLDVPRDMPGDVQLSGLPGELTLAIDLIRREGGAPRARQLPSISIAAQRLPVPLACLTCAGDDQATPLLAHRVPEVRPHRGRPGARLIQLCLRVGHGRHACHSSAGRRGSPVRHCGHRFRQSRPSDENSCATLTPRSSYRRR